MADDLSKYGTLNDSDLSKYGTLGSDQPAASPPSDAANFGKGLLSKVNPVEMVKGTVATAKAAYEHPIDTALAVLAHPYEALKRAKDSLMAGKIEEAAAHVSSALDPTGFATEDSAVKTATPGQRAEGIGELIGTGLSAYLSQKVPELVKTAGPKAVALAGDTTPTTRAVIGLVSPRAKNALELAARVKDAMESANPATAAPVPPALPAFDELTQRLGFRDFASAPPDVQDFVKQAVQARSGAVSTPAPVGPPSLPSQPEPVSVPKNINQLLDEELAARRSSAVVPVAAENPITTDSIPVNKKPNVPDPGGLNVPLRPPLRSAPVAGPLAPPVDVPAPVAVPVAPIVPQVSAPVPQAAPVAVAPPPMAAPVVEAPLPTWQDLHQQAVADAAKDFPEVNERKPDIADSVRGSVDAKDTTRAAFMRENKITPQEIKDALADYHGKGADKLQAIQDQMEKAGVIKNTRGAYSPVRGPTGYNSWARLLRTIHGETVPAYEPGGHITGVPEASAKNPKALAIAENLKELMQANSLAEVMAKK